MYLRTIQRRNKDGSVVRYVQLAHNVRHPESGHAVAQVLHSFGREDQLDRDALARLVGSLSRYLGVEEAAPAAVGGTGGELRFLASKTLGGCWALDGLWRRLGLEELVRRALAGRRCDPVAVERVLFALVANRALDPCSKLAATRWVGEVAHVPGLTAMDEDTAYRAMDLLLEVEDALAEQVFWATATLLDLERAATSLGQGGTPTPYDVLSRFSETVIGGYATEELPARISMLLAQGTGAQWATVWLTVSDRLTLAATWPADAEADQNPPHPQPDARDTSGEGRRALTVRHDGRLLGVLRLQERPDLPLTSVEERLFTGLAAQAGLVLRQVGLRAELAARHEELVARTEELLASRERLIATQDAERRRLEHDIHDGAQQHLVALTVNLRLAQTVAARSPERAIHVLAEQGDAARDAIDTLSQLSRGIYPRLLADDGLLPALRLAVATSPIPVTVEADHMRRLPTSVETALYFCCMEAVQNAAKHSGARRISVRLSRDQNCWQLTVSDDGDGFDQAQVRALGTGAGLVNMADRLDAVGGTVTVGSQPGRGTTVTALVPRNEGPRPSPPHVSDPLKVA